MRPDAVAQGAGFGVAFEWDIPLLDGYPYKFLENVSSNPGVTHFSGCDTPEITRELRAMQPDAVVVNGWVVKTCLQTLWACKKLGIPCLVRGEANDRRQRSWWKRLGQRVLVQQYAACLYIGQANRDFYERRGVVAASLFPAPYCIDNELFRRRAEVLRGNRKSLRAKWHIRPDSTCFLYCGKFENKKHPIELVKSFAEARVFEGNLHLLMVGDGNLRASCEDLADALDLPLTFTGFLNQTEIVAAYVASDCLVLPSDAGETWGLVVNEAMACGRPAIVSDRVGCAPDLVRPGITGDVFPFGDWAALSEMLACYAADGPRLRKMGREAHKQMGEYSPQAAAEGMRLAIARVLDRRGMAGS